MYNPLIISMKMQLKNLFILLYFILSANAAQNLHAQENQHIILDEGQMFVLDSITQNPSGKIYFFEGKEISEPDFYMKIFTRQLKGMTASIVEGKNAIIRFGERYRYGIIFGEAEYKNETEGEPKTQNSTQNETGK